MIYYKHKYITGNPLKLLKADSGDYTGWMGTGELLSGLKHRGCLLRIISAAKSGI